MSGENLDVGMRCVQYMLFVSNFLFVMVALLLISIGTLIKAMYTDFEYFMEASYFSPSNLLIFAGFIIFFVAFFGCWGAIRESTMLVNVYALFLTIILVLEIIAVFMAFTMRIDLQKTVTTNMFNVFRNEKNTTVKEVFDFTQSQLFCCGVISYADWSEKDFIIAKNLPKSCCRGYNYYQNNENITCNSRGKNFYRTPCSVQVTELVSETAILLTTGAVCVAFIQIIGIIFARLLSKTIRNLKTQRLVEAELRRQQIYSQIILGSSLDGENEAKPHNNAASEA